MQPRSIDSRAQPEQSARGASPIERCDAGACGLVDGEVKGLDAQRAQRRPLHDTMLRRVLTCGEHRSDSVSEEVQGKRKRRRGKGGGGALFTVEAHGFHEPDVAVGEVTRDPRRVLAARVHHVRVAPTVVQQCFGLAKLAPPQPQGSTGLHDHVTCLRGSVEELPAALDEFPLWLGARVETLRVRCEEFCDDVHRVL